MAAIQLHDMHLQALCHPDISPAAAMDDETLIVELTKVKGIGESLFLSPCASMKVACAWCK